MKKTHLNPDDLSAMTTRVIEVPRPLSPGQKTAVAGAVLFGVPIASLMAFFMMAAGVWVLWYFFFYSPAAMIQITPTPLPTFTITPTIAPVSVVIDTPTIAPVHEFRIRTQVRCIAFSYPVVDMTYFVGEYLPDTYLIVVGQYPQPVPSPEIQVWYLLADGSWLPESCFYVSDRPGTLLPKSPGLIPPTITPVPSYTPTPTNTPLPIVMPTATYFSYLPVPYATLTPTITPVPTATPQLLSLVESLPAGAVPGWCLKIPSPPVEWVELFGKKWDAFIGSIESDGFIYLGPAEAVLFTPAKVRGTVSGVPVEREVIFSECGSWAQR